MRVLDANFIVHVLTLKGLETDTLYLVFKHRSPNCIWIALQTIQTRPKQTGILTNDPVSVKRALKSLPTGRFPVKRNGHYRDKNSLVNTSRPKENCFGFKLQLAATFSQPKRLNSKLSHWNVRTLFRRRGVRCVLRFGVAQFVVVTSPLAATANNAAVRPDHLAPIVHTFITNSTNHSRTRTSGSIHFIQLQTDELRSKQLLISCLRVCSKLPLAFLRNRRESFISQTARTLTSHHAHGFIRFCIQKRCGYLPVINVLQRSLSQPHASRRTDRVSHAAIDLHPNDRFPSISSAWIVESDHAAAEQRHTRTQQLSGAHMPVQQLTFLQDLFKRLHCQRLPLQLPSLAQSTNPNRPRPKRKSHPLRPSPAVQTS